MRTIMLIVILVLTCACTAPIKDMYLAPGYDGSWDRGASHISVGMTWTEVRKYVGMYDTPSSSSSTAYGTVDTYKGWSYNYDSVYLMFVNNELQSWLVY